MMDLSEFPWAAIIMCFPDRSWGSICNVIFPGLDACANSMILLSKLKL